MQENIPPKKVLIRSNFGLAFPTLWPHVLACWCLQLGGLLLLLLLLLGGLLQLLGVLLQLLGVRWPCRIEFGAKVVQNEGHLLNSC